MEHISILERLDDSAESGKLFTIKPLWQRTIESLRKKKVTVIILSQIEPAKYLCKITWEDDKPTSENKEDYTISNYLWLAANKHNTKNK